MINVWRGSLDYPWVSLLLTVYIQSWDLLQQNHINSYKVKSAMGEGIGFWSPFCGIKQDINEYLRSKLTVWKCLPVKFGKDLVPRILCVYVCVCWYVHMSPGALEARSVRFSGAGVTGVVSHLIQIFRTELLTTEPWYPGFYWDWFCWKPLLVLKGNQTLIFLHLLYQEVLIQDIGA